MSWTTTPLFPVIRRCEKKEENVETAPGELWRRVLVPTERYEQDCAVFGFGVAYRGW